MQGRTRLPARLRRSDGYLFGQVAIRPYGNKFYRQWQNGIPFKWKI